ncbi:MAG: oxidoreductase [Armatimonadota bacterium]
MSALFTPIKIRDVVFRNRVVMPPMVMNFCDEHGRVTEQVLEHYGARADAGTGLVIVEAAAVDPNGRCWSNGLCAFNDDCLEGLVRLAARIHAGGAVAGIQLVHGGPQCSAEICGETVGPSAVSHREGAPPPRELTVEEITAIEDRFAGAAARAVAAGFNLVEIHGAHGFLLDSFLSRQRNTRTDDYGDSLAGRMRMLLETCRLTRERVGNALLDCRISIFNKLSEGFTSEELQELVTGLHDAGLDLLHVSTDGAFKGYFNTNIPIAQWVKKSTTLPIITAGGLGDPRLADRIIADGIADFAAVGHGMLDDAEWTKHAAEMLK